MSTNLPTLTAPTGSMVSGRSRRRGRLRGLQLSLADALFVLLMLRVLQLGAAGLFNDPGTGWHLRTGEYVLTTHAAPTVDHFSYTRGGQPWVATQWLADAVMAAMFAMGGFPLIAVVTAAVLAAIFRWVYRTHLHAGGWPTVAIVVAVIAAASASGHFLARPLVVTTLLVPVCFWTATEYARGRVEGGALLILPIGTIFWTNLHPGVLGGIATVGVCAAGCVVEALLCKSSTQRKTDMGRAGVLIIVTLAMATATLVNPYGLGWHVWIRDLLRLDMAAHVIEWRPPKWSEFEFIAALCLLAWVVIAAAARRDRMRWAEALVIGFWTWQAFSSVRHVPLLGLVCALQLARLMADLPLGRSWVQKREWVRAIFSDDMRVSERDAHGGLISFAVVALLVGWLLVGGRGMPAALAQAGPGADRYSYAAVQYIRTHPPDGPLLNDLNYGGMLIHFAPDVPVMADDRFGLYGQAFLDEYVSAILTPEAGGQRLIDAQQPACVLMNRAFPFATWLQHQPGWVVAFEDDLAVVLVRESIESESEQ